MPGNGPPKAETSQEEWVSRVDESWMGCLDVDQPTKNEANLEANQVLPFWKV